MQLIFTGGKMEPHVGWLTLMQKIRKKMKSHGGTADQLLHCYIIKYKFIVTNKHVQTYIKCCFSLMSSHTEGWPYAL